MNVNERMRIMHGMKCYTTTLPQLYIRETKQESSARRDKLWYKSLKGLQLSVVQWNGNFCAVSVQCLASFLFHAQDRP